MTKSFMINNIPFTISKGFIVCLVPIHLDIETSNNHADDPKDLITWVSSIQVEFNGFYYLLRTPEQLIEFYKVIYKNLQMEAREGDKLPKKVITFIHNSSYDLSYLVPYFSEYLPHHKNDNQGLIESPNKFLTYCQAGFEWRCSYRLSNMSLAKWSQELNVEHKKQIGLYDYDKVIYQDDELTEDEQTYDKYDILSMKECIIKTNQYYKDDMATMPLTFTGYVRRDLRRSCKRSPYYRKKYFLKNRLDCDLFYAYEKSYAGGITHNNRFFAGITIEAGKSYKFFNEDVFVPAIGHRDFKSHYPTQMACYNFPIGSPQLIYDITVFENDITIDEILSLFPQFYTMSVIRFYYAEIKTKDITIPFMQFSKMNERELTEYRNDNGRIIYASGSWVMYLDNLMLDILNKQYDLEYEVIKVWKSKAGKLPAEIVDVVNKYFKGKSDKKNIVNDLTEKYGKLDERTIEASFDLMQTKVLLNSLYGCTATNPIRENYSFDDDFNFHVESKHTSREKITEALDEYYNGRNNFLQYSIGCTVTSLAKYELFEYIEAIGYKNILYVDTDSAFYIKTPETDKAIEDLNLKKRLTAQSVILDNGQTEYYDCFDQEPDCIAFRGLHSKCYGVVTSHGLELTIAGIPARTIIGMKDNKPIYLTREEELSEINKGVMLPPIMALNKLEDDYTFYINTGVTAIYIGAAGNGSPRKPTMVNVNGHMVSTAGGCVINKLKEKKIHDNQYDLSDYEYLSDDPFN